MSEGKTDGRTQLMLQRSLAMEPVRGSIGINSPSDNGELDLSLQGKGPGASEDDAMCTGIEVRREQHVPTGTGITDCIV